MKKAIIILTIMMGLQTINSHAQFVAPATKSTQNATSIGIVIYSNDIETMWNVLRLANHSKSEGDTVTIFLLGKGVELDSLVKINADLKEQTDKFLDSDGVIMGCGTCLASRKNNEPELCTFSSMGDLYNMIRENKVVLTF